MVHPDRVNDQPLIDRLRKMVCTYTPEQHAGQVQALLNRADLWPLLPTITVPTLIALGREDPWRSVDQHRQMAEAIPGARLEVIADCGHMSPAERPRDVTNLLEEWLDDEN
jgi:pimeloyl-ACP methyl ester carboxylesterase